MYRKINSAQELREYIGSAGVFAFDFETAPDEPYRYEERAALDARKSSIVGISFSVEEGSAVYVPLAHKVGENVDNHAELWEYLSNLFANSEQVKVAHNLAFESMFLYARGIVLQPPCHDTIASSQLSLKGNTGFRKLSDSGLKTLVPELFKVSLPSFGEVLGGALCSHFDELDPADAETVRYACADSDFALRLYYVFNAWFDRWMPKHRFIAEKIESPTAVYCGLMKYNGLLADSELMNAKAAECEARIADLKSEIAFIIGDIDLGANASTAAFKNYLYKDLGLPVLKTTAKFQEAADDEVLILLSEWCEINKPELVPLFKLVQEFRKIAKLKSTYIDGYGQHINSATGRIHADLMPLATETGRFACRNPNMQNCFDDQTEILTKRGFILFKELSPEDAVAEWEGGEIYFVKPLEYISRPHNGRMVHLKNQHTDLLVTPEHRCLLQNRKNRMFYVTDADGYSADAKQLHAAQYAFGQKTLTAAEITLLAATQADGYFHDGGICFNFAKIRKYRRLTNALRELGAKFTEGDKQNGQVWIRVLKGEADWVFGLLGERKVWGEWVLNYDRRTVKAIIKELYHWDGCFTRGSMYSSSVRENADWMQIIHALTGIRAHFREYRNGNANSAVNYQLDIVDRDYSLTANVARENVDYKGNVYCVSVPSGFIMVRRNGQICITGNCPRTGADEVGVRNFFIAPKGKVLLSLDFSQIELRVGAFYCRDDKMLETYRVNGDIHNSTADVVFGVKKHDKEQRTIAKNVNFGTFYGLFPRGLQRTLKFKAGLNTPIEECEKIIENLKSGYPKLSEWQAETVSQARKNRYTETFLGRRRYLPNINSKDWNKRSFTERCALNTPIQGTAADILKLAIGRILAGLSERPWLRPLLQIHDELVFELPESRVTEAVGFIKSCMETPPFSEFDIPIIADAAVGARFGELTEINETEEI